MFARSAIGELTMTGIMPIWAHPRSKSKPTSPPSLSPISSREQRLPQRRQGLLLLTVLVMWLTTTPGVHGQTLAPLQSSFNEGITSDIQSSGDISQTDDITPDLTNVFTSPSIPLEVSSAGRSLTQPDMDHSTESLLPREKATSDFSDSVTLQSSSRQSSPDIDNFSSGPFDVLTRKTFETVAETTVRLDTTSGVDGTVLDINSLQTKDTPITDVLSTMNGGKEASSSQVQTESIDGELLRTFSANEPIESSLYFSVESNQTLTPVSSALKLLTTRPHSSLGLHIGSTDSVLTLSDSALTRDAKTAFSTGLLSTPQIQTQLGQSEGSSISLQTVNTDDTNQQTSASFLRAISQSKSQNYQSYFETQDKSQIPSDVQMRSDITNSETALPLTLLQTLLFSDLNEHNTWKDSAGSNTIFSKTLSPTDSLNTDMEISNSAGIPDTIDTQSRHKRATLGSDIGSLQDQTPGLQVHVTSGLLVGGSLLHSSPDLTSSIEPTPASDFLMSATATPELMTFSAKPQLSSLPSNTLSNPQSDVPSLSPSPTVRDEEPRFGDSSSLPDSQASMEVWFDASHEFSSHTISQTETFSSSIRSSNSHSVRDIEILTPSFSLDVSFQSRNHVSFQVTTSLFQTTDEHLFVTKSTSSALNDFDFSTLNPRDSTNFSQALGVHESSFLPQETTDDSKSTLFIEPSVSYSNTQTFLDSTLLSLETKNFLNSTKVPNLPLLTGDTDIFSSGQSIQFIDYSSKASLEVNNSSQNLSLYPTTDFTSQEMLYSHQSELLQTPNLPEASIDTTLVKISQGVSSMFVSDLSSVLMSDSPALEMSLIPEHYSNASFSHQSEMLLTPSLPDASIDTRVVEISQDISSQFVSDLSSGQISNSPVLEMSFIPEYYSTASFSHQSKILRTPSLTEVPIDATPVEISQDISSQFVSDFRSLPMSASPALEMSLIPEHYSIASFASDKEYVSLTMSQLDLETPVSLGNYISSTNVNLDLQSNGIQKDKSSTVVLSYSKSIEIEHTIISTLSTELSSSYLAIFSISDTSMTAETASVTTSNSNILHLMPSFTSMPSYNFGSTMSASVYTEFSLFTPETVSLTTENLTSSSPDLSTMLHKSTRSIIDGTTANVTDDLNSQISLPSTKIDESVSMMSNTVSNYYNESVESATEEYFVTPSSSSGIEMMTSQTTIPAEELESLKLTPNQSFSLHPSLTESMIFELTSTAKNTISLLPDISTVMISSSSVVDEFATENFNINMTPSVLPSSDVFLNLNITEVSGFKSIESTPVFIDVTNTSEIPIGLPTTRTNITSFGDVGSTSFNVNAIDMFNTVQNSYNVSENSVSTVDKVFMTTLTTIDADATTAISDVSNSMYITLFPTESSSNETVINITPSQSNQDTSYAMNTFQFLSPSSVVESHSVDERYSYVSEVDILSFVSDHPSSFPMPYTANNSAMQTTQLNMEEISTFPTVFPTPEMFSTIYNATVTFEESINTASASQIVDFLLPSQLNSTNTGSVYPDSVSVLPTDFSTAFLDQASSDIIENNFTVDLFLNSSGFISSSVMLTPSSSLLTENATEFLKYTETLVPSSPTSVYDSGQYITLSPSFASLSNETLNSDSLMTNIPTDKMTHTPADLFPSSPTDTFNVSFMIESISGQPTTSVPSTLGLVSGSFNLLPSQINLPVQHTSDEVLDNETSVDQDTKAQFGYTALSISLELKQYSDATAGNTFIPVFRSPTSLLPLSQTDLLTSEPTGISGIEILPITHHVCISESCANTDANWRSSFSVQQAYTTNLLLITSASNGFTAEGSMHKPTSTVDSEIHSIMRTNGKTATTFITGSTIAPSTSTMLSPAFHVLSTPGIESELGLIATNSFHLVNSNSLLTNSLYLDGIINMSSTVTVTDVQKPTETKLSYMEITQNNTSLIQASSTDIIASQIDTTYLLTNGTSSTVTDSSVYVSPGRVNISTNPTFALDDRDAQTNILSSKDSTHIIPSTESVSQIPTNTSRSSIHSLDLYRSASGVLNLPQISMTEPVSSSSLGVFTPQFEKTEAHSDIETIIVSFVSNLSVSLGKVLDLRNSGLSKSFLYSSESSESLPLSAHISETVFQGSTSCSSCETELAFSSTAFYEKYSSELYTVKPYVSLSQLDAPTIEDSMSLETSFEIWRVKTENTLSLYASTTPFLSDGPESEIFFSLTNQFHFITDSLSSSEYMTDKSLQQRRNTPSIEDTSGSAADSKISLLSESHKNIDVESRAMFETSESNVDTQPLNKMSNSWIVQDFLTYAYLDASLMSSNDHSVHFKETSVFPYTQVPSQALKDYRSTTDILLSSYSYIATPGVPLISGLIDLSSSLLDILSVPSLISSSNWLPTATDHSARNDQVFTSTSTEVYSLISDYQSANSMHLSTSEETGEQPSTMADDGAFSGQSFTPSDVGLQSSTSYYHSLTVEQSLDSTVFSNQSTDYPDSSVTSDTLFHAVSISVQPSYVESQGSFFSLDNRYISSSVTDDHLHNITDRPSIKTNLPSTDTGTQANDTIATDTIFPTQSSQQLFNTDQLSDSSLIQPLLSDSFLLSAHISAINPTSYQDTKAYEIPSASQSYAVVTPASDLYTLHASGDNMQTALGHLSTASAYGYHTLSSSFGDFTMSAPETNHIITASQTEWTFPLPGFSRFSLSTNMGTPASSRIIIISALQDPELSLASSFYSMPLASGSFTNLFLLSSYTTSALDSRIATSLLVVLESLDINNKTLSTLTRNTMLDESGSLEMPSSVWGPTQPVSEHQLSTSTLRDTTTSSSSDIGVSVSGDIMVSATSDKMDSTLTSIMTLASKDILISASEYSMRLASADILGSSLEDIMTFVSKDIMASAPGEPMASASESTITSSFGIGTKTASGNIMMTPASEYNVISTSESIEASASWNIMTPASDDIMAFASEYTMVSAPESMTPALGDMPMASEDIMTSSSRNFMSSASENNMASALANIISSTSSDTQPSTLKDIVTPGLDNFITDSSEGIMTSASGDILEIISGNVATAFGNIMTPFSENILASASEDIMTEASGNVIITPTSVGNMASEDIMKTTSEDIMTYSPEYTVFSALRDTKTYASENITATASWDILRSTPKNYIESSSGDIMASASGNVIGFIDTLTVAVKSTASINNFVIQTSFSDYTLTPSTSYYMATTPLEDGIIMFETMSALIKDTVPPYSHSYETPFNSNASPFRYGTDSMSYEEVEGTGSFTFHSVSQETTLSDIATAASSNVFVSYSKTTEVNESLAVSDIDSNYVSLSKDIETVSSSRYSYTEISDSLSESFPMTRSLTMSVSTVHEGESSVWVSEEAFLTSSSKGIEEPISDSFGVTLSPHLYDTVFFSQGTFMASTSFLNVDPEHSDNLFDSSESIQITLTTNILSTSTQNTPSLVPSLSVNDSFSRSSNREEPIQSSTFDSHSPSSTVTLDLFSGNSSSNKVFSDLVNETAETSSPGMVSFSTLSPNFTEVLQSDLVPASSAPGENSTAPPLDKTLTPSEVSMVISATEISSLLLSNVSSEVLPLLSQDGNIFNSTTPTPSISIPTYISYSTLIFSESVTTTPGPVVVSPSTVEYSTASSPEPSPNGTQISVLQQSEATSSFLAFPESPTLIESLSATQTLVSQVMFDSVSVFEPVTPSSVQPDYNVTTSNLSKLSNSEFSELSLDTTASLELFTSVGTIDVTITPSITDLEQTTLTLVTTQSESLMPVSDITVTSSASLTLSLMPEFSSENSALSPATDSAVLPSTSLASSSMMETVSVTLSPIDTTPVLTEISTILALTASETSLVTATMAQSTPITELPSVAVGETSMLSILSSMSLIASSVTPTIPIASSTLAPTPTLPPDTTTPPADNNLNNTDFWVITGIRVRSSVNVSSERFLTPIERGLANAYYVARNIRNGTVVPLSRLRKRRRRKRATSADADPNIKVDIVSATRQADNPTNVDIVHVVEENGQLLTGAQATDQLKLLSDQELAIQLGHVVAVSAKPYVQEEVTTSEPKTDDENGNTRTLIIIGSVVGAAIFGVVFVTVLCICCWGNKRCCKRNAKSYEEEDDEDEEGGSVGVGPGGKQRARGGNVITDIVREVKVIDGAGKVLKILTMPDRSERSVATHDHEDNKAGQLLVATSENIDTDDASNDASDNSDIVMPGKAPQKRPRTGKNKKQNQNKESEMPTGDDNKENSTESVTQSQSQDQTNQSAKSSGLCRGEKSVEVKDSTKPVEKTKQTQKSSQNDAEQGGNTEKSGNKNSNNNNVGKKGETPKKSSGFCRSDKDVAVIDSLKSQQGKSDAGAAKTPHLQTEPAVENSANATETGDKKPDSGAKSGGLCRRKADVSVIDSTSKPTEEIVSNSNPKLSNKNKNDANKGSNSAQHEQKGNSKMAATPSQSTNQKPPTGRSGTCCGGSSVEVKESLRPLDKPEEEAEPKPKKAQDDSFGEPVYSGLPDVTLDDDDEEETEVKEVVETSYEVIDDDDTNESDASDEIIIRPEPPPPILKKKKKGKKKKNSPEYVQDTPSKSGPLAMNPRKGKYSVTTSAPEQEEEPLYAQVESSPTKKKATQAKLVTSAAVDAKDTPSRRKKKKKLDTETQDDIRSAYENQIASLAATSGSEGGFTINDHPTVEEESELLENAEAERKKNKHRLREKKLRESGGESPVKKGDATSQAYENAQREIDKVLAPKIIAEDQDEDSDGSGKKKKKKSKDKDKKKKKEKHKGEENGGYSSEEKVEESLEEAKAKMHQLLDDAFSLFSHSRSSMGNKVAPAKQSSEEKESPKPKKKRSPRSEAASNKSSPREGSGKTSPREEEKKHTPMHIVRSHEPYDSSGLISWDPYKASDETAIISLPTTQTNLSSKPPQQEKLTTSTFTESLPGSLRPNYYATQPAEPIIIRSSELGDPNRQPPSGKDYYTSPRNTLSSPATASNDAAYQQRLAAHHGMFQNPLYDESLAQAHRDLNTQPSGVRVGSRHAPPYHQQPARTVRDTHYEPYYGMSSYQEIPQTSTIPGQADHNPHRYREASTLNGIGTLDYSNPTYSNQHYEMAVRPYSENLPSARRDSIRDNREGGEVMSHTAPQRGENPNIDVVDAVSGSLRPGVSPQPLISSLREELQMLASRKGTKGLNNTAPSGGANSSLSNNGGHSLR